MAPQFMSILYRLVQWSRFLVLNDGATKKLKCWSLKEIPNHWRACDGSAKTPDACD
ncbi:hypothetical protein LMG27174_02469 [Paraburkholderia rhynchosiae]|uniref:Uncharacterized protein n=1 Tax=Paraburkholderia rhynchosiae TaxID=487049 RepID=A0A6J5APV9_9BURK|nr:hypothetical protein LMG27174_02469 [Paraburkholderia rhynchosiae]